MLMLPILKVLCPGRANVAALVGGVSEYDLGAGKQ